MLKALGYVLFPRTCFVCGALGMIDLICPHCHTGLPWLVLEKACPECAKPSTGGLLCGDCLSQPHAFEATKAVFEYQFPIDRMVQALKYHGNMTPLVFMADAMAALWPQSPSWTVVPMPMHPLALGLRGFNQAHVLARLIAKHHRWPFCAHWAYKTRATPQQAGLLRDERRQNMEGAFAARDLAAGASILLIDDVMTTGASLHALAHAFRAAGAARIHACVLARTPDLRL
jgi:ComF family protein